MSFVTIARSGAVRCKACGEHLGTVSKEPDATEYPWWATWPDGEAAGFGPEATRGEASLLLLPSHECPAERQTSLEGAR